jgi:hypothetical protein
VRFCVRHIAAHRTQRMAGGVLGEIVQRDHPGYSGRKRLRNLRVGGVSPILFAIYIVGMDRGAKRRLHLPRVP